MGEPAPAAPDIQPRTTRLAASEAGTSGDPLAASIIESVICPATRNQRKRFSGADVYHAEKSQLPQQ
ncbi:hypothetical protein D3C73_1423730 [compost metagenome]